MRVHITKSLQTRCKTIRWAVIEYNEAAASLEVPQPPLEWIQVSNYQFVEQFTLLQEARNDLRQKPWSRPVNCEVLKLRHQLNNARQEIIQCNVETRRILTAIYDESEHFTRVLTQLQASSSPLYGAIEEFICHHCNINTVLRKRIDQIHRLDGFSGIPTHGTHLGGSSLTSLGADEDIVMGESSPPLPQDHEIDSDGNDCEMSEDSQRDIGGLIQFFDTLNL